MNARNPWPAVVLAGVAIAAAAGMAIARIDPTTIVIIVSLTAGPVLAGLVAAQGAQTAGRIDAVAAQTNGNHTRLLSIVEEQGRLLAQMQPPAPANHDSGHNDSGHR